MEVMEQFKKKLKRSGKSENTIIAYSNDLQEFAQWLKDTYDESFSPENITTHDIIEFKSYLISVKKRKASTVNRKLVSLSAFLGWCEKQEIIPNNPAQEVEGIKEVKTAPKALERLEMKRLVREVYKNTVSYRSYKRYKGMITNHLLPYFSTLKVDEVRSIHIERYQNQKLQSGKRNGDGGLSKATIAMQRNLISSLFSYAQRLEIVEKNPVKLVPALKVKSPNVPTLTAEEVQQILKAAKQRSDWLHDFLLTAVSTGMRRNELLGLRWKNVDLERNNLSVVEIIQRQEGKLVFKEPKTPSSKRSISISDNLVKTFKRIKKRQAEKRLAVQGYSNKYNLVFPSSSGEILNPNTATRKAKRAFREAQALKS